jgi:hypothetical protein
MGSMERQPANQDNPPMSDLMRVREKSMQAVMTPLIAELKSSGIAPVDRSPSDRGKAYGIVSSHMARYDLSHLEFSYDDLKFLMTDPFGNMLRRPILFGFQYDVAQAYPARTPDEERIRGIYLEDFRAKQYDYFRPATAADIQQTRNLTEEVITLSRTDAAYSTSLIDHIIQANMTIGDHSRDLAREHGEADRGPPDKKWLTDPGHGIMVAGILFSLRNMITEGKDAHKLSRELSLLLVEDSRYYAQLFMGERKWGFKEWGGAGGANYFFTAEDALEEVGKRGDLPDVTLTDIELGRDRLNGLSFARELRRIARERGKDIKIFLYVYSSNVEGYERELDEMRDTGVIDGYFRKRGFTVNRFVDELNTRLQ